MLLVVFLIAQGKSHYLQAFIDKILLNIIYSKSVIYFWPILGPPRMIMASESNGVINNTGAQKKGNLNIIDHVIYSE
jgi:hypothetical protein